MDELIKSSANQVVDLLRSGKVSTLELLETLETHIQQVDVHVNALPTLCFDRAKEHAKLLANKPVDECGLLCGIPVTIKDLSAVKGVLTTYGSSVFKNNISAESDPVVHRIEANGGVIYAKSNTPEFGAGGNTFNEVFGPTNNPWDTSKSAGGSSGGAAAALASGSAWLSQGTDNAGSLRSPASFCGIVGLRPSIRCAAIETGADLYQSLSAFGPMARNVEDVALFLDAMIIADSLDGAYKYKREASFLKYARKRNMPAKVAYSEDLGITPVDPEVADICRNAATQIFDLGIAGEEACPDFTGVHESYQTLRALGFATNFEHLLESNRAELKPDVIKNISDGLDLSGSQIRRAVRTRSTILRNVESFFSDFDLLITPAAIVPPFDVKKTYVTECNGKEFNNYIDWLSIAYAITLVSLPVLSLPCGFTKSGLPVGLQIVGKPRGEAALLSAALVIEEMLNINAEPIMPLNNKGTACRSMVNG
ncbi:amidase [Candidatus Endobugula sertula]|uniref:Amidase n=1 Tax=Candidatus Endobugula sertula TaxID=62101 RepID=A0A1D2QM89_9GAMM|nr:amidase [Candidatus Endobugula sertula]